VKQVTQRLRDGGIEVVDVPTPELRPEGVLVSVRASLLSAGTERKKVETGRQNLVSKARSRPEDVRKVIAKARRDGVGEAVRAVRSRLDQPIPLGYSAAGVVLAAGDRVSGLGPGQRVACGGGGYAVHAEVDYVPSNLAVPIPDSVDFEAAAFATVGSIALHGVRQADVRLGERVAVIGLGLVGQLVGQILRAGGCHVVGLDLSEELVARALRDGAADRAFIREMLNDGVPADARNCDAVIIAAATSSSDPIRLAAALCRDRGRVVVIGEVGLDVPRSLFYEKELALVTSRSYGPGRYDRQYEERGLDYPIGYVRWTERRNMAAFLELVAQERVRVEPLITERIPIAQAADAYKRLLEAASSPLGIVLAYPADEPAPAARRSSARAEPSPSTSSIGVIGAGSFATRVLIPAFRAERFHLEAVASGSGVTAHAAAERFGARATTVAEVLAEPSIGTIVVATRHDTHASLASEALRAGKAVFVEKPPALTDEELDMLRDARDSSGGALAVGFNRRHAPLALALREHVEGVSPLQLLYRVNANRLPDSAWQNDPDEGGGRLLGEGCHFVDFSCWVVGATPVRIGFDAALEPGRPAAAAQSFAVTLRFRNGSIAQILYAADGADALAKEYVEVHAAGRSAILYDFRRLMLLGRGRTRRLPGKGQDKGHRAQVAAFRARLEGAILDELDPLDTMAVTLAALRTAETGEAVVL
jgi:predicted dehydrogenase